ncbi:protein toll [Nasonia vitripennis]|uniref:TIR domain-containing protein n=1 Tax=Nasonia vitripennis TaxID=7425 RepID=A0A7M7G6C6_NASVI|nr:protein toll [Nasonia vitripennis]
MVRLALPLAVLLLAIFNASGSFSCPKRLPCHCYSNDVDTYAITCLTNALTNSAFKITYQPGDLVQIQCENSPNWSRLLQGTVIDIGSVREFVFTDCEPPGPAYSSRIVNEQLRAQNVKYLKYENLIAPLSAQDLDVFPDVRHLELTNNPLGELGVPRDLLRGLPVLNILELRNTNIQKIPQGFFNNSRFLRTLELSGNNFKSLTPGVFDGLEKLELLNIQENDLRDLKPDLFRGLKSLELLDIHQNSLKTLPVDIFADLENLESINLSVNNFTSLPADLFLYNPKLKVVKLLYNKCNLTTLPSRFFSNLTNLKDVTLMRNGIHYLPEDLFWYSTNIVKLNLNRNYLQTLPFNLFKDITELETLTLFFNDLQYLDAGIFFSNKKLRKLDLSKNRLRFIDELTFAGLESLQELLLEYNELSYIDAKAFAPLSQLRFARFANNKLTLDNCLADSFGQFSPFHSCSSLEELNLAHNNITKMYSDWTITGTNLRILDLSYNSFESLQAEDLQFMSNNIEVDLRYNNIHHVNLANLEYISANESGNPRQASIFLSSNPIHCDCKIYDLVRYLDQQMDFPSGTKFYVEDMVCDGPKHMAGLLVSRLKSHSIKCLTETCASDSTCDCWMRPSDSTLLLDCAGRNLTNPPSWIDTHGAERVELDLSRNKLSTGPNMTAKGYNKVVRLNLSENKIIAVDESLIAPKLKILNLHDNKLTSMNSEVLRKLANDSMISQLTLRGNPWICDCSSHDLLSYVRSSFKQLPDLLNITCRNSNVSLSSLSPGELCPTSNRLIIMIYLIICLFALFLGCASALYYQFQERIKVWLYAKNLCLCLVTDDEMDRNKTYDAFISYSHKDEEFVMNELVAKLENGPKPYKLCIHVRDWLVGEWIPMQIARSVEESRRTIVVLSPNFIESIWGRMEFQTAHKQALSDKRARLIVVVYGEIGPTDELDPELRAYLQMNTYVKWGDPWFWQKLNYAMPHLARLPEQVDQENNCSSTINRAIVDEKQINQPKVTFADEINEKETVIETLEEMSR